MNYEEEIYEKLGKENVKRVLREIRGGRINRDKLRQMAKYMHPNVYGVFVWKSRDHEPDFLFQRMLDVWYNNSLCKLSNEEALEQLILIREKVGLNALPEQDEEDGWERVGRGFHKSQRFLRKFIKDKLREWYQKIRK